MIRERSTKPSAVHGRRSGSALRSAESLEIPLVSKLDETGENLASGIESGSHQPETLISSMTVASFVEQKFAPEHINLKRYPSRLFYQAILKHVIRPEQVERIFKMNTSDPRRRLKSIEDWPYLGEIRLCDVRHEHVSQVTSAATAHGYSVVTVRHIRNVIGTIFSHAIQEQLFFGENPISLVKPIPKPRELEKTLTPAEARTALSMMRYPERELTLIGAFTDMSPAEIIGLQWGHVNMMEEECYRDGKRIPPMTISVIKRWYRGELDNVKKNSCRDLPIDQRLLQVLMELRMRSRFTRPSDFVLVSQFGTPISHDNIMTQRLRPIARCLNVPSVSSRVFQSVQGILSSELDKTSPFRSRLASQTAVVVQCEA
ncbi:MAG TPA: site-specific integrase [Blastocatellia bacterium]|nr:site-specific integrase [Blastocatellia bacterium]